MGFLLSLVLHTICRVLSSVPQSGSAVSVYPLSQGCSVRVQVLFPELFRVVVACWLGTADLPNNLGLDLIPVGCYTVLSLLLVLFGVLPSLQGHFYPLVHRLVACSGPYLA